MIVREDRIYVADSGLRRILAFDRSTGQPTATVGRRGAGPGEFRFLSWIGDCGGDIHLRLGQRSTPDSRFSSGSRSHPHIPDWRGGARVDVDGAEVRRSRYIRGDHAQRRSQSESRACYSHGQNVRATSDFVLLEPDGSLRSVLGTFLGEERYREAHPDGTGFSDYALIWGLRPVFASSPQGFVVGTGEGSSLVRYDVDGNVLDILGAGGKTALSFPPRSCRRKRTE